MKDPQGRFPLTPESAAFLVTSKAGFHGGMIRHCSEHLIPKWVRLNDIVATGQAIQAVNEQASGSGFFAAYIFPMGYPTAQLLARHLNLNGMAQLVRILDLAAGAGVWGIALARSSEQVRITALDWPEVIPVTRQMVGQFGLTDRFSYIEEDLLQADFGTDYTIATLGHILHSEGEERSRALLAKTFQALASGGIIAIAEFLLNPERTEPVNGLLFAVNI